MKKYAISALILASLSYSTANAAERQQTAPNPPRIKFVAEEPLQLPPDQNFGEIGGVAVNSQGHVFVYSRGNVQGSAFTAIAAQLFEFDQDGRFIREIGRGIYGFSFAHAVRMDKDDNIWLVDKGSNLVMKLSSAGRVVNAFGRKDEPTGYRAPPPATMPSDPKAPAHRPGLFNEPTDVAFNSEGNVFISDGYQNSRVAKINKDGDWVKSWGERGTGPSQFSTVHGIAVDKNNNVYVADRGNGRIQVFDANGKFLRQFNLDGQVPHIALGENAPNPNPFMLRTESETPKRTEDPNVSKAFPAAPPPNLVSIPGAPLSICINPGDKQFLFISDAGPSRIYKVTLEGKVVGMIGEPGAQRGEFRAIHAMACPNENTLWVGELLNWRVQKLTLQ